MTFGLQILAGTSIISTSLPELVDSHSVVEVAISPGPCSKLMIIEFCVGLFILLLETTAAHSVSSVNPVGLVRGGLTNCDGLKVTPAGKSVAAC